MMGTSTRIGIFGGSFDPIHVGHLIVAEILHHTLRLDHTMFLPAGDPPHKPHRTLLQSNHRISMISLSIQDSPYFEVSTVDTDRRGASYTVDSLEIIRGTASSSAELIFLMGQDSLRDFPGWHEPGRIAQLAKLGVAHRAGFKTDLAEIKRKVPEISGRVEFVPIPLIGVSSRDIRGRIAEARPYRYQVLPSVAEYIIEHGLYQNRTVDQRQIRTES